MANIVVLARDGQSSRVVVHALRQRFGDLTVIIEGPSPGHPFVRLRLPFLRRRLRRLGAAKVAGQLLFYVYGRLAEQRANQRKRAILAQCHLDDAPLRESEVHRVSSVNAAETIALLRGLDPDVVVVNGTGIISSEVLTSVDAPFINTHTGITPSYRGVHGGYWALVNGDKENCGVTIHLVDAGIDTGGILYQSRIEPTQEDNYFTYPMLQYAAGVPLLLRAVSDALAGRLSAHREEGKRSALWTHPTLFEYLRNGWIRRVW
jgi:phosphoribosylglycinamide formyltransferase 1